jgi:hypothetical protein
MILPQPAEIWTVKDADWVAHHLIVAFRGSYKYPNIDIIHYDYDTLNLETGEPDVIYFRLEDGWEQV